MFDIGFFELLVVAIVGLLVIGPERLPETIRTLSLWVGRIKRSLSATRAELEQQLGADDIRRQLHNESIMRELNASREEIERVLRETPMVEEYLPDHAHMDEAPAQQAVQQSAQQPKQQPEQPEQPEQQPAPAGQPPQDKP